MMIIIMMIYRVHKALRNVNEPVIVILWWALRNTSQHQSPVYSEPKAQVLFVFGDFFKHGSDTVLNICTVQWHDFSTSMCSDLVS